MQVRVWARFNIGVWVRFRVRVEVIRVGIEVRVMVKAMVASVIYGEVSLQGQAQSGA